MSDISIHLNFVPITTGKSYGRNGKYTFLSKAGQECSKAIKDAWCSAGSPMMLGVPRLKVSIEYGIVSNARRDLDNMCKLLIDTLVKCGCIKDDSYIDDLHLVKKNSSTSYTDIVISELLDEEFNDIADNLEAELSTLEPISVSFEELID